MSITSFFKSIFGGSAVNIKKLISEGAIIVDVRTEGEYRGGHLKNSINIPLDQLSVSFSKLNKNKPIITCCAYGMRSASAKRTLKSNSFTEVYNGGGWISLRKLEK